MFKCSNWVFQQMFCDFEISDIFDDFKSQFMLLKSFKSFVMF